MGISHSTDYFILNVLSAVKRINNRSIFKVCGNCIDCKITAGKIFFNRSGIIYAVRMPSVGITAFGPESCNFNFQAFKMKCYSPMLKAGWKNCPEKPD